ncbi:S-adenosylmethionine decarboxylase [Phascolomyces articulosus]|uniref:S-adenosylmethionine decarboxylase n=1 Tax=Phascolomyces articulosus TaxID=60185 RepID=A0AAD5PDE3_9FUNG|nr:S-adenosylmethionine decarboxylase [Phascolomyces articulosus]
MVDLVTPCQGDNYSAQQGCFEGPEKLLEVWFSPSAHQFADHQDLDYYNSSEEDDGSSNNDEEDKTEAIARFSPPRLHRRGEYPTTTTTKHTGLRVVPRSVWDDVLALVKCTVLNVITNDHVDAYLLSESSMFVYPHKLILKTCGTTTLLLALPQILQVARQYCGFEKVWRVFYSRKAFMFPERQVGPHRSWNSEVEFLNKYFDNGSAYTIGKVVTDQWHLYLTKPADDVLHHNGISSPIVLDNSNNPSRQSSPTPCDTTSGNEIIHSGQITPVHDTNTSPFGHGHTYPDQTVEICMRRLNPEKMQQGFYHNPSLTESGTMGGQWVDQWTGIGALYPQAQLDSFLFEPCGYSSNGLQEDRYFTIHVTPEPDCSYASFETNIPVEESHALTEEEEKAGNVSPIETLVSQVTRIFDPESFTVTFFTSHHHKDNHSHSHMVHSMGAMAGGYKRTHRILYEFDGYDLVYGHYSKDITIEHY